MKKSNVSGNDDFGFFELTSGKCANCGTIGIVARYNRKRFGLPHNIDPRDTILTDVREHFRQLGVTCGCYAKFQRQVAHISDYITRYKEAS